MSYDENDAAWDQMYESIGEQLYPDHKAQAIEEFTTERLRSFYMKHPDVMCPAIVVFKEAKTLLQKGYSSASLVFFTTAIELFLKSTLLKPVVYGLVHNDALADVIVQATVGQPGFDRYRKLLGQLFKGVASIDLNETKRKDGVKPLLEEAVDVQTLRNKLIHQGRLCTEAEAKYANEIAYAVFVQIVGPMFNTLRLSIHDDGDGKISVDP